jgi:hypothetical protein
MTWLGETLVDAVLPLLMPGRRRRSSPPRRRAWQIVFVTLLMLAGLVVAVPSLWPGG